MIVYISGKMTGLPDYNRPAFNAMAAQLRAEGFEVINPAELPEPAGGDHWHLWMRQAVAAMMRADALLMLDGWLESRGACAEVQIAALVGIDVAMSVERLRALMGAQ